MSEAPRRAGVLGETFTLVEFGETRAFDLPCVYLMAHEEAGELHIHYAGQTHCLRDRFAGHHRLNAAVALGATHVLVRGIELEPDRRAFETILRWHFRPPLNEEEAPTHMQAWRAAVHCGKSDVAARARAAHLSGTQPLIPAAFNKARLARG